MAQEEKAEMGYKWCLEQIENQVNDTPDAHTLYGVIKDWYAQYLLDRGNVTQSLTHLKEAYNACKELTGVYSEQSMLLLNDLGITSWRAGDLESAQNFLSEAVNVSKNVEDKSHAGVVHANLGLIYLEKGIRNEAQKYCKEALYLGMYFRLKFKFNCHCLNNTLFAGRRHNNIESTEQANYCFEQIKLNQPK